MTFQLLYRSIAVHPMPHISELEIMRTAIIENKKLGICGFLVREKRHFFQVLEGHEEVTRSLFARICKDKRHFDVNCLLMRTVTKPMFKGWSMGYAVNRADIDSLIGTSNGHLRAEPAHNPSDIIDKMLEIAHQHSTNNDPQHA